MLFDPLAFFSSSHPPSEKAKEYIYVEDYKLIRKWIEAFLSPDHDELLEKKLLCELKGGQKPLVRILQIGSTGTMGSEMSKKDAVKDYQMYIDGRWERSSSLQSMEVVDPYNGNIVARVQKGTREDAKKAILAAHHAADDWGDALASKRADHLYAVHDIMAGRKGELIEALIHESGSVRKKAELEVAFTLAMLLSAAGEARRAGGETIPSDMGKFSFTVRRPAGVVAAISPFNFPLLLSMKKVFHALAVGNAVVLKPASTTPVNSLIMAEIFEAAGLPNGAFNVVTGPGNEAGDELVSSTLVNHISFTGEHATGKAIAEKAAKNLTRLTLELGSCDPIIILRDADLEYAIDATVFGAFFHQGEICMSAKRIIVEESVLNEFKAGLVERVESLVVGDPSDPMTDIGPLINPAQVQLVSSQVADALDKGGRLLCGGRHEGNFYYPTLVDGVVPGMRMYHEEVFGPARSIIAVRDSKEAVAVANDTIYGLSSAVITENVSEALLMASKLRYGMVHINDSPVNDEPHIPFGGMKGSGIGREGGRYSTAELTELQWITIQPHKHKFPI